MSELSAIDKWLYTTLSADGTLTPLIAGRVYDALAPEGATFPCIVFQYQAGHDVRGNGPGRIMVNGLYLVRAIGKTASYATLQAIVDRIDELLQGHYGSNADGEAWAVREQPFKLTEVSEGIQYRHSGGLYRIWAQEA